MSMIQGLPTGNKSGINSFLFGQAAAIGPSDLKLMAVITVAALLGVTLFYRQLLVASFDPGFARASGLPVRWVNHGLMLFLSFAVVIALQAVGVVLVSALLIIPAATAYLLTDRMHRMLVIAVVAGVVAGAAGSFVSFLAPALPTGPFIVLASASLFGGAFLFSPRHGLLLRWWHRRSRNARVACENSLKAIYHVAEAHGFQGEGILLRELAERRRSTLEEELGRIRSLVAAGSATLSADGTVVYPTPTGWQRASEIVRNHRLWELYLTHAAHISPDHVHEDAEKIEHVIGEEIVRELERRLQFATVDPHGKAIPAIGEIRGAAPHRAEAATGYRRTGA
jgi:manganese/zinc/iron transport system permease protein